LGKTVVKVTVRGPLGSRTIEAMVDTWATNTTIERSPAGQLGIVVIDRQEVVLANGKSDTIDVGSAELKIEGTTRVVPIFIYDSNLIGLTTLEAAGLRVNPATRQLEKVPGKLLGLRVRDGSHLQNA
jgi:predicted aspartyl protease